VASVFATLSLEPEGDFFNLADAFALEYAQTRAAELVGKKWVDGVLVDNPDAKWAITETTREELRELIARAFAETWTPAELAKQIDSAFVFSADRAAMIAETETAMALTAATVHTGTEAGATTKTVQMSNLHDIDDECDDAEQAGEVPIDSPYPDGSLHVPLHPRCRCVELLHFPQQADEGADT
jgi:phage terminase large subunit-like protein